MKTTRVTVLLLVTGLFAGMWSADSPDGRTAAEPLTARRGCSRRVVPGSCPQRLTKGVESARRPIQPVGRPVVAPLPAGISAGTYLVVDQFGRTDVRTVMASEAFPSGRIAAHVAADQYAVRVGQNRWHFIRLAVSSPTGLARSNRAVHPEVPH